MQEERFRERERDRDRDRERNRERERDRDRDRKRERADNKNLEQRRVAQLVCNEFYKCSFWVFLLLQKLCNIYGIGVNN